MATFLARVLSRRRDAAAIASASAGRRSSHSRALPTVFSPARSQFDTASLFEVPFLANDRRVWSPEPSVFHRGVRQLGWQLRAYEPARRISGVPARVVAPPLRKPAKSRSKGRQLYSPAALLFQSPGRVIVCVQRKVRKEVMHARGIAGSRVRRGRRNAFSNVRC